MMDWKPKDMPGVMPYVTVTSIEDSLEFYKTAFGFEQSDVTIPGADQTIWHAEMKFYGFTMMFGKQGAWSEKYDDVKRIPKVPNDLNCGSPISLYVYCPNVDEACERAKKAGAKVLSEPEDMFWGDRMCSLQDIDGHVWNFATHTGEVTELPT